MAKSNHIYIFPGVAKFHLKGSYDNCSTILHRKAEVHLAFEIPTGKKAHLCSSKANFINKNLIHFFKKEKGQAWASILEIGMEVHSYISRRRPRELIPVRP